MSNDSSVKMPYNLDEDMAFTNDRCFLCGAYLKDGGKEEHVFPKWLLNKYDLWNARIGLLNGTDIPYRQLTVPCCVQCNGEHLSQIEKAVAAAAEHGYDGFAELDEIVLFQWMAKIFYGLQFRELSLIANRCDPNAGTIITCEQLADYRFLHCLLQSIRKPYKFEGPRPWSMFIYQTHSYGDIRDFDYHDAVVPCTFSIRLGNAGIIAALSDHGAIRAIGSQIMHSYCGHKLHPMQFQEIAAEVHYNAARLNRTPTYFFITDEECENAVTRVLPLPLRTYSTKSLFNDWDQSMYAKVLWSYWKEWGYDLDDIISSDGRIWSLLRDQCGEFIDVPSDVFFASPITGKAPSFEGCPLP